jgi:hypothetical protein
MNPQKHGATRAIAQEKTPTQTSWGFGIGGAEATGFELALQTPE